MTGGGVSDIGEGGSFSARLREPRSTRLGGNGTAPPAGGGLRLRRPLISSWENGTQMPPEDRLRSLALFYATSRSLEGPSLLDVGALTKQEEHVRRELIDELVQLREAQSAPPPRRQTGALGGRFYYF